MRAVVATEPGGPEVLTVTELPDPEPGPGEVLLDVVAAGLNRADLLQRQGFYPPPPGASEIIGMEVSGRVAALGEDVGGLAVGDEACALLAGGGYASKVVVPVGQLMPLPPGVDLVTAAALPEVAATVYSNLVLTAGMRQGDTLLVHGGAGGIGSFAIQLAVASGVRVLTTAGSAEKRAFCRSLGADVVIDYREEDFVEVVREATDGRGVDVVLDNMGAKYLMRNVEALALDGRLVVIGLQGGTRAELDLNALLRKRAGVIATNLRGRSVAEKSEICAGLLRDVWPLLGTGAIKPVVEGTFPLERAADAHRLMTEGSHTGKILLTL
ncbi:NAD(P)H-quinone oxidoreductase [Nocardioides sp. GY 10127]|uniref:NAD(P)H-quinone oxidoreductase n=1 Tax=Nocardioides sp. GY 10127 TaxID=2569762 RepID=UPI0010A921D8|nr:NAD(P)H-quinone oxidoreductase [Nocardioides sp. GY 10127]TIC82696.1 NAD(P)H-quinone oxidoreductase [Nocardioides sp. GY 10127]